MQSNACARRTVLGVLAGCAAIGSGFGAATGQPLSRARLWRKVPPEKPRPPYLPMVVLDPGHGGIDPGAIGPDGVYEKNIVYATARDLARDLAASGRFRVALTRGPDEFVPLRDRVARARALHADLFLAIHADALPDPRMRGLSVFTLSAQASDREAAALADSENEDVPGGLPWPREPREVSDVLIDLERRQTDNSSLVFARDVVTAMRRKVALLENPQRSAAFAVLTAPDIPSVLVELGCLSNPVEEHLLEQPAYRQLLARGLAQAIEAYFTIAGPG